jgi:hypothetical protein
MSLTTIILLPLSQFIWGWLSTESTRFIFNRTCVHFERNYNAVEVHTYIIYSRLIPEGVAEAEK